ncbi:MAG: polysaccharide deacetylase family protein, partial [Herpetosiphonaceae bacterium]|nr:polysaccharide deacetylase family protein [Herpetosiphonaceae bacterium]
PPTTSTPAVLPDADLPLPSGPQPPHVPPPQPPVPGLLNTHGDRSRPLIALTFDACETPNVLAGYDEHLVQILLAAHAPATMFLCGHWVSTHSDVTRMLAANPLFELGNHSWGHPDFSRIRPATMDLEISRTQAAIYHLTGRQPTLFRMPYGNWSRAALAEVSHAGLRTIQWDVVTGDPDPNVSAKMIIRTVQQKARNGSIIVMHMNGRGVHTHEALPTLIQNLRAQGYILATVSQVLGLVPLTI